MDLIIANDTPRIDSAIAATEKIVSDLCEINKNTVSKTEFEKLPIRNSGIGFHI